jgi:hypothetical protein
MRIRTGRATRSRRNRLDAAILDLRTFGFLARRLWRPYLYAAGASARRRVRLR